MNKKSWFIGLGFFGGVLLFFVFGGFFFFFFFFGLFVSGGGGGVDWQLTSHIHFLAALFYTQLSCAAMSQHFNSVVRPSLLNTQVLLLHFYRHRGT